MKRSRTASAEDSNVSFDMDKHQSVTAFMSREKDKLLAEHQAVLSRESISEDSQGGSGIRASSDEERRILSVSGGDSSAGGNSTGSSNRLIGGLEGELEFEIVLLEVHAWLWSSGVGSAMPTSAVAAEWGGSADSRSKRGNATTGMGMNSGSGKGKRWTVWRTGAEVLQLYSNLVSNI
jgi:hypothetical protein